MANNYGNKAYHKTSIATASKERILLMLYEAAIRYFKRAKIAIEQNNVAEKGLMIGKAQDIVNELNNTLDFDKGGDIAKQLETLYIHIFNESTDANINNDTKKIDHCVNLLTTLYDGWKEAINQLNSAAAPAEQKKIDFRSE